MSPQPTYGRSRDKNEPEIVSTFEKSGFLVQRHSAWDLDISCQRCKTVLSVEVKIPKKGPGTSAGRLTPAQTRLIDAGWPLHIVHSVEEALALIERHRAAAHAPLRG